MLIEHYAIIFLFLCVAVLLLMLKRTNSALTDVACDLIRLKADVEANRVVLEASVNCNRQLCDARARLTDLVEKEVDELQKTVFA